MTTHERNRVLQTIIAMVCATLIINVVSVYATIIITREKTSANEKRIEQLDIKKANKESVDQLHMDIREIRRSTEEIKNLLLSQKK